MIEPLGSRRLLFLVSSSFFPSRLDMDTIPTAHRGIRTIRGGVQDLETPMRYSVKDPFVFIFFFFSFFCA